MIVRDHATDLGPRAHVARLRRTCSNARGTFTLCSVELPSLPPAQAQAQAKALMITFHQVVLYLRLWLVPYLTPLPSYLQIARWLLGPFGLPVCRVKNKFALDKRDLVGGYRSAS